MPLREQLIHFQNTAEQRFQEKKTAATLLRYVLALMVFMASTLFAAFTLPIRLLAKALRKKGAGTGVHTMDSSNIDKILQREPLVLIDFWAAWCGPCIMMQPALENFAGSTQEVCVAKVNADTNKALTDRFKIRGLPQLILLRNGKEIKRHAGPMTQADLARFCAIETAAISSTR